MTVTLRMIDISQIDFDKDDFCHRSRLHDEGLCNSIQRQGIIVPPLFIKNGDRFILLSGFKRMYCLRRLKKREVSGLVISREDKNPQELFLLALESNRNSLLSDFDKGIALEKGRKIFSFNDTLLRSQVAPLLGLPPSLKVVEEYMRIHSLIHPLKVLIEEEHISFKGACVLAHCSREEQTLLYKQVLPRCFFSASELKIVCDVLNNILKRDSLSLTTLLKRHTIQKILRQKNSSPRQRGALLIQYLKEVQGPSCTAMRKNFTRMKKRLKFTKNIQLKEPVNFEEDFSTLAIQFSSENELHAALTCIHNNSKTLKTAFDVDKKLTFL